MAEKWFEGVVGGGSDTTKQLSPVPTRAFDLFSYWNCNQFFFVCRRRPSPPQRSTYSKASKAMRLCGMHPVKARRGRIMLMKYFVLV
jgi:hypothetical protein